MYIYFKNIEKENSLRYFPLFMIFMWYLDKNFSMFTQFNAYFLTQEILKDFSESDFHSIKTEFQQVLSNRKEMTQFLEEWLKTHFDIEELKSGIQKENDRVFQVNKFYNNRIIVSSNFYYATSFFLLLF